MATTEQKQAAADIRAAFARLQRQIDAAAHLGVAVCIAVTPLQFSGKPPGQSVSLQIEVREVL